MARRRRLVVWRPEEAGRQLAVFVRARRRTAGVDVVEDAEQRFEVRVAVAADVDDLVAVLLGTHAALCQRRHESSVVDELLLLLLRLQRHHDVVLVTVETMSKYLIGSRMTASTHGP